jgi:hypothetical protein
MRHVKPEIEGYTWAQVILGGLGLFVWIFLMS